MAQIVIWRWIIWKKIKNLARRSRAKFFIFSKLSTSRSQFVGQILNSDPASSYFPFNTPTVFVFLPVLHPNRSFEISMTIVLILQQGLSESSRSRVSLLHSAQYNVFVFVFVYLSFFPFCFCLGRRSSLERLLSNSRVAFDHQNRHHHHQMSIQNFITLIGARTEKNSLWTRPGNGQTR